MRLEHAQIFLEVASRSRFVQVPQELSFELLAFGAAREARARGAELFEQVEGRLAGAQRIDAQAELLSRLLERGSELVGESLLRPEIAELRAQARRARGAALDQVSLVLVRAPAE